MKETENYKIVSILISVAVGGAIGFFATKYSYNSKQKTVPDDSTLPAGTQIEMNHYQPINNISINIVNNTTNSFQNIINQQNYYIARLTQEVALVRQENAALRQEMNTMRSRLQQSLEGCFQYTIKAHLEQCDLVANVAALSQGLNTVEQEELLRSLQGEALTEASSIAGMMYLDSAASDLMELAGNILTPQDPVHDNIF